jgi:hypothetical protein
MLPMVLNGPNVAPQDAADGLEWAQYCPSAMLPMVLNGPNVAPQDAADGLEWA